MVQASGKARYSVTLSHETVNRLKEQAAAESIHVSTILARIVDAHYSSTAASDCEEKLNFLQHQYKDLQHQSATEVEALTRQLTQESEKATQSSALQEERIKELEDELHVVKTSLKSLDDEIADKDDKLQALEQERQAIRAQAEEELATRDDNIRKLEEGVPELLRRLDEEKASKETITTGLQHELELSQNNLKKVEEWVVNQKGQIQDLKEDKQSLQKQLELVTLRLPAPKESILSRIFGRRKRQEEG